MALPAPNLDDRRFQDLVDEAKRYVQRNCPEWTDHNVSDPGVTLIETFAYIADLLLYRLNRVPELHYVKFLDLIGVKLLPPSAARAPVTFWLSAPQPEVLHVPVATEVATMRAESDEPASFTTVEELAIVPCARQRVGSSVEGGKEVDQTEQLDKNQSFLCFDSPPKPGDALYVGLSEATPSNAVVLRFECEIEGVGVDPTWPPLVWEAWNGAGGWDECDLDQDGTGGLNRNGDVTLHVPPTHAVSVRSGHRGAWLRARVLEAQEGQPFYSASPKINRLSAFTIGGTTDAVHAEIINGEILGTSDGTPNQRFAVLRPPVVPAEDPILVEVAEGEGDDGWTSWAAVTSLADSGPDELHFVLDPVPGELTFGQAVRQPDGKLRGYGRIPPAGSAVRVRSYRTGGGRRGNVARGAICVLKSSLPYITRVENRRPAVGGVDRESLEGAKDRGPIALRTLGRAVTREDYEVLAHEVAPELGRVKAVEVPDDPGAVKVKVVPDVPDEDDGSIPFEDLLPSPELVERITEHLEERRVIGARVLVEYTGYQPVSVIARVLAKGKADRKRVEADCLRALYGYFHPLRGGPDGQGWPYGRPVNVGEAYAVMQRVPGVEYVEDARLFLADPAAGTREKEPVARVEIAPDALVFSWGHLVRVEQA